MTLPHFAAERRAAAPCCDAIAAVRPPLWMNILPAGRSVVNLTADARRC